MKLNYIINALKMPSATEILIPWLSRLLRAGKSWWVRKHANEAAALAFYSLFSLIPILIIGLTVASWIVDKEAALKSLLEQTSTVTGFSAKSYLTRILSSQTNWLGQGVSPIFGGILLAFSATKVITELRRSLSKVFGNPRYQRRSQAAVAVIIGRFASLFLIIILGLSIAAAVIYETLISLIKSSLVDSQFTLSAISILSPAVTLVAMTILAATVMRWLPTRPPKFKEALIGGLISSILIMALKVILSSFLAHTNVQNLYGSAITLVLILLWVYFAMQAILYGAEFTEILTEERRSREENATATLEGGVTEYPTSQTDEIDFNKST